MAKRKTLEVKAIVTLANQYFEGSPDEEREGRRMLQTFVESLLFRSNQYKGFGYIEGKGIVRSAGGNQFPDDSRIFFYV